MRGRRVQRDHVVDLTAGDYCRQGSRWTLCLPTGVLAVLDDRWTVTEHDDATITVSPSIHDAPDGWHGFLEHGVWREI